MNWSDVKHNTRFVGLPSLEPIETPTFGQGGCSMDRILARTEGPDQGPCFQGDELTPDTTRVAPPTPWVDSPV